MFDEEESCKNSQLESPLALTGMDNIDQNTKQTNTRNGKQKEKDEMMIHNHEDIEKKKRNKISSQKEAAADASDVTATLLVQGQKESISTDLIQVEEVFKQTKKLRLDIQYKLFQQKCTSFFN